MNVSLTNLLLAIILAILIRQFYPAFGDMVVVVVVAASALYGCYWLVARYPKQRKKQRALRMQEQTDEKQFWQWWKEHEALRAKYDPRHEWDEATMLPEDYLKEIRKLNLAHQDMLCRRNGWTYSDLYNDFQAE